MPGDDAPRYLSRSSVPPYTPHPARALRGEMEAVDPDWVAVHHDRLERERRRAAARDWPKARQVIERALERYENEHDLPRDVRGPVRRVELVLRSVDKRLGLRP